MNGRIGIDSTRFSWEQEASPEEARAWFVERTELLGSETPRRYRSQLHAKLYSPNGEGAFALRFSYLGGRRFAVEGSLGCFLAGSKGANLANLEDIPEVLRTLARLLELDLRFTKVEAVEVASDCALLAPYADYLPAFRTPARMKLTEEQGTLYYRPQSKAKRTRPRKQFKVYDKGVELGTPPAGGCLMRAELTLGGGASMIGQTLKAGRPLMAIDLQDETIQKTLVSQFKAMINELIKEQAMARTKAGGKDALLEGLALELMERGGDPMQVAERVIQSIEAKNRRIARKRITKQVRDIISVPRADKAKELREGFGV